MKLLKKIYGSIGTSIGLLFGFIILGLIALGLGLLIGCIEYFLLSVAFPQYLVFGWEWWRFLALGILSLVFF